jgi:hypothetical protein
METAIETVKLPVQLISFIAGIALGRLIYILIIYLWSELSDRIIIRKIHKYYDNMQPGDGDFTLILIKN